MFLWRIGNLLIDMSSFNKQLIKEKIKKLTFWNVAGFILLSFVILNIIYNFYNEPIKTLINWGYSIGAITVILLGVWFHSLFKNINQIEWKKYKGLLNIVNGLGITMFGLLAITGILVYKYIFNNDIEKGYFALYSTELFIFTVVTYFALVYKIKGAINLLRGYLIIFSILIFLNRIPIFISHRESLEEISKEIFNLGLFLSIILHGALIALCLKGLVITFNKKILILYHNKGISYLSLLILTVVGFILILPILMLI